MTIYNLNGANHYVSGFVSTVQGKVFETKDFDRIKLADSLDASDHEVYRGFVAVEGSHYQLIDDLIELGMVDFLIEKVYIKEVEA